MIVLIYLLFVWNHFDLELFISGVLSRRQIMNLFCVICTSPSCNPPTSLRHFKRHGYLFNRHGYLFNRHGYLFTWHISFHLSTNIYQTNSPFMYVLLCVDDLDLCLLHGFYDNQSCMSVMCISVLCVKKSMAHFCYKQLIPFNHCQGTEADCFTCLVS